jgi:cytoplasmic iron level regulating protein YaaA (DUF328/UPF0246 family)
MPPKRDAMLYTLFSPSEGKHHGGDGAPLSKLLFGLEERREILERYDALVNSGDMEAVKVLFGYKKEHDCEPYVGRLFKTSTMSAVERYDGVAYDYLDTASLPEEAMDYLHTHAVIFSNLYGPVMGGDLIADYKVKQGNSIGGIAPDVYYKEAYSDDLDTLLDGHDILDLRAGYYNKFYKPSQAFTTLKFIKAGKVVSHWAKAYRGTVLRQLALHEVDSLEQLMKLEIEGLMVNEIRKIKNKTEIVFDIVS